MLTEASDKLLEVDEAVLVLVEQAEEPGGQRGRVHAAAPGPQYREELAKLARVDAVLLQVGQARVVALRRSAARAPVAAHDVLGLHAYKDGNTHAHRHRHTHTHTPKKIIMA